MAKRKDVREESCDTPAVADEATTAADTPQASSVADAVAAALRVEDTTSINPDAKLPPAAQLGESAPAVAPPPFLREHENRTIAARPAAKPDPAKIAASGAKENARSRFTLLAVTLALAAGLGAAAGAVSLPSLFYLSFGPAPAGIAATDIEALKNMVAQHAADLGALKASLEQSVKATAAQYGKIAERLDRTEPATKLTKISEALERLERRAGVPTAHAQNDVTGSVSSETKPKPTIIEDYVVRRVYDGVALVEGRKGVIEVEPGTTLPGAGRVEEIRRQDGRWVVVTNKGLIVPPR
jgi:hypothetical protein